MDHGSPTELRDLLARLNARLAVQEETNATLSTQFAALQSRQRRRQARRGRSWLAGAVLASFLALVPLGLLAANPFNDLTGGVHDANIDAIYNAGITTGCVPNVAYCPTDFVTREQMASFLARTAGLGSNPPVANALTAQTAVSAQTAQQAQNATNAGNATTVGGYAPNGLVRVVGSTRTTALPMTLADDFKPFTALSIYAPKPGFILVSSSVQLAHVSGTCPCTVEVRIRKITGSTFSSQPMTATIPNGVGERASVSITWVAAVDANSTKFDTIADQVSGTGVTQANVGEMTALYVPFDGTYTEP